MIFPLHRGVPGKVVSSSLTEVKGYSFFLLQIYFVLKVSPLSKEYWQGFLTCHYCLLVFLTSSEVSGNSVSLGDADYQAAPRNTIHKIL